MNLHTYLQYAAVTSPIVLAIILITLAFKSWLDRLAFQWNTAYATAMQKVALDDMFGEPEVDSDSHLKSVPGMKFTEDYLN